MFISCICVKLHRIKGDPLIITPKELSVDNFYRCGLCRYIRFIVNQQKNINPLLKIDYLFNNHLNNQ